MQTVPMGSIGPHNSPSKSCFLTPREKRRILISSSDFPYGFASLGRIITIRVYLSGTHPWRFSDQGVPSFNFGNSLVSHIQWLDENPTVDRLSWNMSRRTPAHNFCITINNLSNQFLFHLKRLRYSRTRVLNLLFPFSLSLFCASTNPKTLSEDHFSHL